MRLAAHQCGEARPFRNAFSRNLEAVPQGKLSDNDSMFRFQDSLDTTRLWQDYMIRDVVRGRMIDLGRSSFIHQTLVSLPPVRKVTGFLTPMRDGCFVTPVEQPGHNLAMRAFIAIRTH